MCWMSLTCNVHCAGANADSNEWSVASAGATPDGGKGAIAALVIGCSAFVILSCSVPWLYVCDMALGFVYTQTPTQRPTPLPTAEPTLSPSMVNACVACINVFVVDIMPDVLDVTDLQCPLCRRQR